MNKPFFTGIGRSPRRGKACAGLIAGLLISLLPTLVCAQATRANAAKTGAKPAEAAAPVGPQASMVITGDREAPLVLSIIPWVEPKPVPLPEVPLQSLVPKVIDYNHSIVDEPVNRPAVPQAAGKAGN